MTRAWLVFKKGFGYVAAKQPDTVTYSQSRLKAKRYHDKELAQVVARNVRGEVVEE